MISDIKDHHVSFGEETCGFILKTGELIKVTNQSAEPLTNFEVSEEDLLKYEDLAEATWHTHTKGTCNLSLQDYATFRVFPDLLHYIYDGTLLAKYSVSGKVVILDGVTKL